MRMTAAQQRREEEQDALNHVARALGRPQPYGVSPPDDGRRPPEETAEERAADLDKLAKRAEAVARYLRADDFERAWTAATDLVWTLHCDYSMVTEPPVDDWCISVTTSDTLKVCARVLRERLRTAKKPTSSQRHARARRAPIRVA